jgi:hypothetical protein
MIAPFGNDVVPDVYRMVNGSSGVTALRAASSAAAPAG